MMPRPAGVLFDRDGVLLTVDGAALAKALPSDPNFPRGELASRWAAWLGGHVLDGAIEERTAIRAFLSAIASEMGLSGAERDRLASFDYAGYVRAYPDAAPALEAARRAGLRVGVLTNNSALLSAARMLEVAGLSSLVDVVTSAQILGAAKPAPAAYLGAAAALGVPPEACLFFDNHRAWVEGARRVGLRAYLVDRAAPAHALEARSVRDLSALETILASE
jgi:putative hydrolase of the HAD superfamily